MLNVSSSSTRFLFGKRFSNLLFFICSCFNVFTNIILFDSNFLTFSLFTLPHSVLKLLTIILTRATSTICFGNLALNPPTFNRTNFSLSLTLSFMWQLFIYPPLTLSLILFLFLKICNSFIIFTFLHHQISIPLLFSHYKFLLCFSVSRIYFLFSN